MLHGWIPPERFLPYLSAQAIRALPELADIVVLQPVAAIEQHGPHLPIAVDTAIVMGVLGRALEALDPDIPCYCLPPLCYGKSNEHIDFPGTIALSAQTLLATLAEVLDSLYRSGFRKVALVNGHGGQPQIMDIAARDARVRHRDLNVFPLFLWRVPHGMADHFGPRERELGIHAGAFETSLMLALLPATVAMEKAVTEWPQSPPADSILSMEGDLPFAWLTHDLSKSGVLGDARAATRSDGDALLAALAQGWIRVITDMHRFRKP
jgi:creatinine amidohydrolase